jgi:hypothetical protein
VPPSSAEPLVDTASVGSAADTRPRSEAAFMRFLAHPRLAFWLMVAALCLSSPCLFMDFYLDDWIARYVYLPEAEKFFRIINGGYGLANGVPADSLWQVEQGWAPWWIYPELLMRVYRPVSLQTHILDARLWPSSSFMMHAHNLFWLAVLVLAATRMYRGAMGTLVGGLAALLFAIDHTHGFATGLITNRHTLITGVFGVISLDQYLRSRLHDHRLGTILGPISYVVALLSGEAAVAFAGYMFAFAAVAERGSLLRRGLGVLPYLVITVAWRAYYNAAGYGASGSGLYIDPVRAPAHFFKEFLERGPILLLGQYLAPPSEVYTIAGPTAAAAMLIAALIFAAAFFAALVPILAKNRIARFWTLGMLFALIPASSTFPHNRQLMFVSFGALALIAHFWQRYALELRGTAIPLGSRLSGALGACLFGSHLFMSPLALPFTVCSPALSAPLHEGITAVGDEIHDREAVFITAPDYFSVKLIQLARRAEKRPLPKHWRVLSFGSQPVVVRRVDDRTLILDYVGGILGTPFLELYRDRRIRMTPGEQVKLEGLVIEVLAVTPDGRASQAKFTFDQPLGSEAFRFYYWTDETFKPFRMPAVGASQELPGANMTWGFK